MAQTFIGRLIMGYQDNAGPGAKKTAAQVQAAIRDIEGAGRRLASAPWGVGFQRQIDKIGLASTDLNQARQSWDRLQNHIKANNLNKALARSEVSGWKAATLSHFAQVRAAHDRDMTSIERRAKRHAQLLRSAARPAYLAVGGYTGGFAAYNLIRGGLTAASQEHRVRAETHFSGLSTGEQKAIDTRAGDLSTKYRMQRSVVSEMLKDAALNMPSTDDALAVADDMARALLVLANQLGSAESAVSGLRKFNRSMDNIEKIKPSEYKVMLEGYLKAAQVIGTDMDPGAYEQAIKYSRAGGKVFGTEFLTTWLPQLISQVGGSNAGTQLRAAFDQFIVGRASKQALSQQRALGIRDENGLIQADQFAENPIIWMNEVLLPALEKRGLDTSNEVELARVIGELTNNRMSSDMVMTSVLSYDQMKRIAERINGAMGGSAADEVQDKNPFAAYEGFVDSLQNLSAAVLPMETISAKLNRFADTVNAFQDRLRENPSLGTAVGATAGATGVAGAVFAGKAVYGLMTAGTNLNLAAAALQRAAAVQGAGGLVDGVGKGKGANAFWRNAGRLLGAAHFAYLVAKMPEQFVDKGSTKGVQARADKIKREEESKANHREMRKRLGLPDWVTLDYWKNGNDQFAGRPEERRSQGWVEPATTSIASEVIHNTGGLPLPASRPMPVPAPRSSPTHPDQDRPVEHRPMGRKARTSPGATGMHIPDVHSNFDPATGLPKIRPELDTAGVEAAADAAGVKVQQSLSVTGTPLVDTSSIDAAIARAQQLLDILRGAGPAAEAANAKVGHELNRSMADMGPMR